MANVDYTVNPLKVYQGKEFAVYVFYCKRLCVRNYIKIPYA